jgi:Cys-rich repeat protein
LNNADCSDTPSTPKCKTSTKTCVNCLANADCPGGFCDLTTNECLAPECTLITGDPGCSPLEPFCYYSRCVECLDDTGCDEDEECDLTTHTCELICDPECTAPEFCLDGVCVECEEDADCAYDEKCLSNECVVFSCPQNFCVYSHNCIQPGTRVSGTPVKYCAAGALTALKTNNANCTLEYECLSNICANGKCTSQSDIKSTYCWIVVYINKGSKTNVQLQTEYAACMAS